MTLWSPLARPSSDDAILHVWDGEEHEAITWNAWLAAAERVAAGLRALGVRRGDRVAMVLVNTPDACRAVLGAWLAGATVVSVPLPSRGSDLGDYFEQVGVILAQSDCSLLLCREGARPAFDSLRPSTATAGFETVARHDDGRHDLPQEDDVVFIQYSSGSTGAPKGCELTARAIAEQLRRLQRALAVDAARDRGIMWLPLSHDMGMFGGLLLTYWTGHPLCLSTPERFIGNPWTWVEDARRFKGTLSAQPNFALDLVSRLAAHRPAPDLSLRHVVVGGERVSGETLRRVDRALGGHGLPLDALRPAYGLAEATLAVSMTTGSRGACPRSIVVDRASCAAGDLERCAPDDPGAVELLSNGPPLPDVELWVDGHRSFGELHVRSPALADGYVGRSHPDRWSERGFATGDRAMLLDGHLYLDGRLDDTLVVGARNVSAHDVEGGLGRIDGVRTSHSAVVQIPEDGRLVAMVEWRGDRSRAVFREVARAAQRVTRQTAGANLRETVFLAPGSLPRTPSGKLQRFRCRELAALRDHRILAVVASRHA